MGLFLSEEVRFLIKSSALVTSRERTLGLELDLTSKSIELISRPLFSRAVFIISR